MSVLARNNVVVHGPPDGRPMLFAHGFGCDQNMWRFVWPAFADEYRVVLFDHVGAGGSDLSAYDPERYGTLHGYADDVLEICRELELTDVVFVGHSVAAMMGVLAAAAEPQRFARLVLVGPSPRYIDDDGYVGGFTREDIEGLLESLESNYLGWSAAMAPVIMGNDDRPELGEELTNSFCRTDPDIAARFARVTFLSDNRADLSRVQTQGPRPAVLRRRDRAAGRRRVRPRARCATARSCSSTRSATARTSARRRRRPPPSERSSPPRDVARRRARRTPPRTSSRTRRAATCRRGWTGRSSGSTGRSSRGRASRATTCSAGGGCRTCSRPAGGSTTRRTSRRCCSCRARCARSPSRSCAPTARACPRC